MDGPGLSVRVSRRLRSTYALSYGRNPMGAAAPGVTDSVWPDEAGGRHDRDRLPLRSRLALRAQRQWRRQSQRGYYNSG
jgi:hypothetical protein